MLFPWKVVHSLLQVGIFYRVRLSEPLLALRGGLRSCRLRQPLRLEFSARLRTMSLFCSIGILFPSYPGFAATVTRYLLSRPAARHTHRQPERGSRGREGSASGLTRFVPNKSTQGGSGVGAWGC